jgi:hypothetical protein
MKKMLAAGALAAVCALGAATSASAATEVVTEGDVSRQVENTPPLNDWVIYTRVATPGVATFVEGPDTPPIGLGSLELRTVAGSDKVFAYNFDHTGTPISEITDLGYETYRTAGSAQQVTALNMAIDYNGDAAGGFSTLVFEPVYNTAQGSVVSGQWQEWDADGSGIWWSTQPINGQCAGATAFCDKTWDEIVTNNPDAVVLAYGVNQGSGNPGLTAAVDALRFSDTTYDFDVAPTSKDDCKKGGWATFSQGFKNQGDCVSYVATGGKNQPNG